MLTKADISWLIDSMKLVFPTKDETIGKLNEINNKLDKFIGEIIKRREEQDLHQGQHDEITHRLDKHDTHLGIDSTTP